MAAHDLAIHPAAGPQLAQRELNRRIVVKYAAVEMDPLSDALGFGPNLARAGLLIRAQTQNDRTRRIICALDKLINSTTDDTYFNWGTLSQVAGGVKDMSEEQVLAVARSIIMSLRRDIANNANYGFPMAADDVVVANLLQWEEVVRFTKKKLTETIAIAGAAAGQVHVSAARFIARNEDNPKSVLSCFKNT